MPSIIAHPRGFDALRGLARRILGQIPTDCPLCEEAAVGGLLCAGCADDTTRTMRESGRRCPRCAQRGMSMSRVCVSCEAMRPVFERVIAAFDYEPPFDSLIGRYKAEHRFGLSTTLAHLLAEAVDRAGGMGYSGAPVCEPHTHGRLPVGGTPVSPAATLLVPIPSSDASLRRRGFNPAAELAASLAARLHLPVQRGVLRRLREGPRQAFSNRLTRLRAAEGLFECTVSVRGRAVGLVDDVMTTGSTVNEAARALLQAGAAQVTVLVAARTPVRQRPG